MTVPQTRWDHLPWEPAAEPLAQALDCHPLVAQILWRRGLRTEEEAAAFLSPKLSHLPDPASLAGIDRAVDRIVRALVEGEAITAFGDYDVDGVTSAALLVSFLRACGATRVDATLPHRLRDGYGLGSEAVEALAARGTQLLITLDCGVTAVAEIDEAVERGMDVVVVDHHQTPPELPRAAAILNPWQPGCTYPTKHLAAVGVTFLLCVALRRALRERGWFATRPEPDLRDFLDLVALGTVADVVPLLGVNRLLVHAGLERLSAARRVGVRALKRVAGLAADAEVSAGQVGFRLGPRLNAAGRLDDASRALRLLLTDDPGEAEELARELDDANAKRQAIEREILAQALDAARARGDAMGLVVAGEGWHPGVVGIVASRLAERLRRPAVVIGVDPETGVGKGSGRSVAPFDLHEGLTRCASHLSAFGGHKQAAGLTIDAQAIEAFAADFERVARERLQGEDLAPVCSIDGVVRLEELSEGLHAQLDRLAPFGHGNPKPVLAVEGVAVRGRVVGATDRGEGHLKLSLSESPLLDAIGFGMGGRLGGLGSTADLAFTLGINEFRGVRRLQLELRALR